MTKIRTTQLSIPVRPAVAKYLRNKLQLEGITPFTLTKKNQVGRLLYHLLRAPQQDRQYDTSKQQYPYGFEVLISHQMWWMNGCKFLTPQAVHDFNRQVEDMIEEDFFTLLEAQQELFRQFNIVVETKQLALQFMAKHGFTDEDFTPDALIKAEYRRRKTKKTPVGLDNLIPNCPLVSTALLQTAHGR